MELAAPRARAEVRARVSRARHEAAPHGQCNPLRLGVGFGRIVALHKCSSTLYQIH